jgi:REP element-mobilizing transposase RayT
MEYRQGSHTKFKIEYHFVWATKYRYHMLHGDLASRVRDQPIEISKETQEYLEKLEADEEWREENMFRNKEPTPANNRPL